MPTWFCDRAFLLELIPLQLEHIQLVDQSLPAAGIFQHFPVFRTFVAMNFFVEFVGQIVVVHIFLMRIKVG